jgi:hypothetical protein
LMIHFLFPFDTLTIPLFLKLPVYILWSGLIFYALFRIFRTAIDPIRSGTSTPDSVTAVITAVTLLSLGIYNLHSLQTEFRLMFHIVPFWLWAAGRWITGNKRRWPGIILISLIYSTVIIFGKIFLFQ